MKLYTEEQILNSYYNGWHYRSVSFVKGEFDKFLFYEDLFINSLKPIELPSDEEIYDIILTSDLTGYGDYFLEGAKWMRDKIQGDNK